MVDDKEESGGACEGCGETPCKSGQAIFEAVRVISDQAPEKCGQYLDAATILAATKSLYDSGCSPQHALKIVLSTFGHVYSLDVHHADMYDEDGNAIDETKH